MGFFNWLRSLVVPGQPQRDVSTLAGTDSALSEEVVDTSNQPMKPHHLRLAIRDARMLPKSKPTMDRFAWPRPKKPKYLTAEIANRRFSSTLRTSNRDIGDLATDEEQLNRYGLPIWRTEADIAAALGLTESQLQHYCIHRKRETSPHYVKFAIPKRSGGHRLIHAPKSRLKSILRKLNQQLVQKLPVSSHAHGFLAGRSVASNARLHSGKQVVVKLDLKDCFPSIHFGRVRGLLIALGYGYPVSAALAVLMTESERQPVVAEGKTYFVPVGPRTCVQGAPTSPGLCNAVMMRLDRRLAGLAKKFQFQFTRYADDLTFSGDDPLVTQKLIRFAREIVEAEGFRINGRKTRVRRRGRCQRVTGVVVNDQVGLSRKERRKIRAAIHQLDPSDPMAVQRLQGKVAYLTMLNEQQGARLKAALQSKVQE